jgi:hypothetical protein
MLTVTQGNKLDILKQCIDRAFRRMVARGVKRSLRKMPLLRPGAARLSVGQLPDPASIDNVFTHISGKPKAPAMMRSIDAGIAHLLASAVHHMYSSEDQRDYLFKTLMADIHKNGAEYELASQMPRAKREYTPRPKRSLVEERADRAVAKVAEWERKAKLAKTKLKKYRAKVDRYTKQGVIA